MKFIIMTMVRFKFFNKNLKLSTLDNKILVLESLKDCNRWGTEYNRYSRAFYGTDGTIKVIRNMDVRNYLEIIIVDFVINDIDELDIPNRYTVIIPYHEYMTYLNGIPEYQSFPHQ